MALTLQQTNRARIVLIGYGMLAWFALVLLGSVLGCPGREGCPCEGHRVTGAGQPGGTAALCCSCRFFLFGAPTMFTDLLRRLASATRPRSAPCTAASWPRPGRRWSH
jgi:hypothetical protein